MRTAAALLAAALPAFTGYSYYYADNLASLNSAEWSGTGAPSVLNGLTSPTAGALISQRATPDGTADNEVSFKLRLNTNCGGYHAYLRATSDALLSSTIIRGTYYAVQISCPILDAEGRARATLVTWRAVAGTVSVVQMIPVTLRADSTVRAVIRGDLNVLFTYIDNVLVQWYQDPVPIVSGRPGIGVSDSPAANTIAEVKLGAVERIAPSGVDRQTMGVSAYPNVVDLRWNPPADGPTGTGVIRYDVYRDGQHIAGLHAPS
jgi:hypothetical protein